MDARPLRICMVTTFYPPYSLGGDGIFIRRLSEALARRGHQVEVVHCADAYRVVAGRWPSDAVEHHPGVTVHTLRSIFGRLSPLATQQTGLPLFKGRALRKILSRGFDVIHYHNISLIGGPGVLALGTGLKLYTPHEHWLVCPTHSLFRYNRELCTKKTCIRCTLRHGRPPQWWRYTGRLGRALRHVDLMLAPSRYIADVHRHLGVPVVHLPLFIPDAPEDEGPGEDLPEQPYFLFAGRLERLKGLHTILPLFRGPGDRDGGPLLLVAGTGSEEKSLHQQVAPSDRVRFLGRVSARRLRGLYRGAVALIVPSLCPDISPMVALEAFQQGTPAIVRDLGGMPEAVRRSGGGIVFRTEEQLRAAMTLLLDNPDERGRIGRLAREAFRREWVEEVHLDRYLSIIRERIAPRRAGRMSLL